MKSLFQKTIKGIEFFAIFVGSLTALLAGLVLLFPSFETAVNIATAARFGTSGYVYYEISDELKPTSHGAFYLLEQGTGLYEDISIGDKLQASAFINFRDEPNKSSRPIFILQRGDCVIILETGRPFQVVVALSGGWLRVATAACGIFR